MPSSSTTTGVYQKKRTSVRVDALRTQFSEQRDVAFGEAASAEPPISRSPRQRAQDRAEERVNRDLLGEHATVDRERRPGSAAAIGVVAIDERHRGPEREVLRLGRQDPLHDPAAAEPREDRPEDGSVRHVQADADEWPGASARDHRAQEPDIRVRRPEEALCARLGRGPCGRRGRSRERPSRSRGHDAARRSRSGEGAGFPPAARGPPISFPSDMRSASYSARAETVRVFVLDAGDDPPARLEGGPTTLRVDDELRPAVGRVFPTRDVPQPLEVVDDLSLAAA